MPEALFDAQGRRLRLNKRLNVFGAGNSIPGIVTLREFTLVGTIAPTIASGVVPNPSFPLLGSQAFRVIFARAAVFEAANPNTGTVTVQDLKLFCIEPTTDVILLEWCANYSSTQTRLTVDTPAPSALVFNSDYLSEVGMQFGSVTLDCDFHVSSTGAAAEVDAQIQAIVEIFDVQEGQGLQ
jgi:hypothetical protein